MTGAQEDEIEQIILSSMQEMIEKVKKVYNIDDFGELDEIGTNIMFEIITAISEGFHVDVDIQLTPIDDEEDGFPKIEGIHLN